MIESLIYVFKKKPYLENFVKHLSVLRVLIRTSRVLVQCLFRTPMVVSLDCRLSISVLVLPPCNVIFFCNLRGLIKNDQLKRR